MEWKYGDFTKWTNNGCDKDEGDSVIILDLLSNELTLLPPEIGNLTNLQKLELEYNQLTSLPPEIGNLTNLQQLSVSDNQLTSLPSEIGNCDIYYYRDNNCTNF